MANYYYVQNSIKPIPIGFEGENGARTVVFDISRWIEDYGNGTALLVHQRPGDAEPYPCATEQKAGQIQWTVQQADLVPGGTGRAQLSYSVGDNIVARSPIYKTVACDSIGTFAAENPGQNWVNEVLDVAAQAEASAKDAASSAEIAKQAETAATQAATTAASDANSAAQSEANASKSASAAAGSATAAAGSETAAKTSETNAAASAASAYESEANAEESESAAKASEQAAAQSESNAKTSETNAASSATAAKTSETIAASSAAAAAESAEQAAASAAAAKTSETNAGDSETAADASADSAAESEKNAAASASAAEESETAAAASEKNAVASAEAAKVSETNAAASAEEAKQAAANSGLPQPTAEDAGKVPTVNSDGTGYELRNPLEQNISDYYAMRRTGKVYQTRFWKFAVNPTSAGEKLLDNAGLVFEPSTDTVEGRDDYLNGQNPMFEWVNVNYIRDDDGAPRPIAIEGQDNYKTSGSVDVGAMQMSFWFKVDDTSSDEYIDYYVSDMPHPELGLVPWPECVKADGTVLPWCIGSKYISGTASDGMQRSQPGLKPTRNVSYNWMITEYQKKGPGYWGAGAVYNTFQILFNAIKGATKSSQTIFAGTANYNFQYSASIQRSEKLTYFPVTNSQANNIVVGAYVSVGYGSNNNGAVNNDRGVNSIHAYADDVKVLRIDDLDDNNKAVYLDLEDGFDTQPVSLTDSLSAPIVLSSMHWWSGSTDGIKGKHDGSIVSNTNSKYPYRVQGREYLVGGYTVASDTVALSNSDGTRTIYAAPRGVSHTSSTSSIQSKYTQIGTIPASSPGTASDYWTGDIGVSDTLGAWYPSAKGSGSSQGCGDIYYAGGTATNELREYLQCGHLRLGSSAGSCCLGLGNGLGYGHWGLLAGD